MTFDFLRAYLFSKKAHSHIKKMSWISVCGIFLGSFSLVLVLSIMSGLNKSTEERLLKHEPHLVVEGQDSNKMKLLFKKFQKEILKFNEFEVQDVLIKTAEGFFNGGEALGLRYQDLEKKRSFQNDFNEPLLQETKAFLDGEAVVLGPDLAYELKLVEGDVIEVYKPESILSTQTKFDAFSAKTLTFSGILKSDGGDRESRLLIYNLGKLFKGESRSLSQGYELYLHEPKKAQALKKVFLSEGFQVQSWQDRNSSLFLALKLERLSMTFLLGLALIITSFSIMSLLILIVVQKQKDIGILMSMGLSRFKLRLLFGGMGGLLSVLGVFSGVLFGAFLSFLLELYPLRVLPPIYQDPYLPADFNLSSFLWILFFCSTVSILSSLVPIFYLSKATPLKGLKSA